MTLPDRLAIAEDEVLVYAADPGSASAADLEHVLDPQERANLAARRVEHDRRSYGAAHVLLRRALSRAWALEPAEWRFSYDESGRPRLAPPFDRLGLSFSLTHTRGLVACAVARGRDVGVDAEDLRREVQDEAALWPTLFGPAERDLLRPRDWIAAFCLKEAYSKARGLGLALDFRSFAVSLQPCALRFADADDPACWRLELLPAGEFALAVAARLQAPAEPLRVRRATLEPR